MCVCLARIIHSHHGRRCDRVRREERFAQRTVTARGACVGGDGAGLSARALRARSTAHLLRRTLAQRLPNAWPAVPAQRRLCVGDAPWWLPQGASAQPPGRWRSDGPGARIPSSPRPKAAKQTAASLRPWPALWRRGRRRTAEDGALHIARQADRGIVGASARGMAEAKMCRMAQAGVRLTPDAGMGGACWPL